MTYEYQAWPCWCTGPDGEGAVFEREEDVPEGWTHHGVTVGAKPDHVKAIHDASLGIKPDAGTVRRRAQITREGDPRAENVARSVLAEAMASDDRPALRALYKAKFNKRAPNFWDAATLKAKIDAG